MSKKLPEVTVDLIKLPRHLQVENRDPLSNVGGRTKFGGEPTWIQEPSIPICPDCHHAMSFVGQIDSIDQLPENKNIIEDYMFGDCGMIYVFFCFDCSTTNSVFQSF
jgi:hypothetical protein